MAVHVLGGAAVFGGDSCLITTTGIIWQFFIKVQYYSDLLWINLAKGR